MKKWPERMQKNCKKNFIFLAITPFLSRISFLHTKSMNDLLDKSQKNKERGFEL